MHICTRIIFLYEFQEMSTIVNLKILKSSLAKFEANQWMNSFSGFSVNFFAITFLTTSTMVLSFNVSSNWSSYVLYIWMAPLIPTY